MTVSGLGFLTLRCAARLLTGDSVTLCEPGATVLTRCRPCLQLPAGANLSMACAEVQAGAMRSGSTSPGRSAIRAKSSMRYGRAVLLCLAWSRGRSAVAETAFRAVNADIIGPVGAAGPRAVPGLNDRRQQTFPLVVQVGVEAAEARCPAAGRLDGPGRARRLPRSRRSRHHRSWMSDAHFFRCRTRAQPVLQEPAPPQASGTADRCDGDGRRSSCRPRSKSSRHTHRRGQWRGGGARPSGRRVVRREPDGRHRFR